MTSAPPAEPSTGSVSPGGWEIRGPVANPARRGPVLLAIHGAESSTAAIQAARLLAGRIGVELRAITVVEPALLATRAPDAFETLRALQLEAASEQERSVRSQLREHMGNEGWTLDVRGGRPAREVCRAAEEIDASVIVVDAAPRRGLRHEVFGIRALQIARRARCPVLSVAPELVSLPRTIVAAIDFSPASVRAAQAALLLAPESARLILAHVPLPVDLGVMVREKTGGLAGGDIADHFKRVRAQLQPYAPSGLSIVTAMPAGSVVSAVLSHAESVQADLVVAGIQGGNVFERFFVGSVAAGIMHGAHCSVLLSPAPSASEVVRLELAMVDTSTSTDRQTWKEILDATSLRNEGRRVTVELDDPAIGAQMQAQGYVLSGIAYDPSDRRVQVMLSEGPDGKGHLTRMIEDARSIAITASPGMPDSAIEIAHGDGHTLILFDG